MRIALLGTRGVPARYGGFETAAEEIGRRLVERGHDVVVYCRNPGQTQTEYLGMHLVNLPAVRQRAAETLSHTMLSVGHAIPREHPDVAFVFNAANAPFLPALRAARIPVAVHVDGLEWKRAKWGRAGVGLLPLGGGAQHPLGRCRDRRRPGDRRPPARRARRRRALHPLRRPDRDAPTPTRLAELGRAPRAVPPRRRPLRAREPRPRDRRRLRGLDRRSMPLVVVGDAPYADDYRAQVRARPAATRGSGSSAASGTPSCSTPSTPTPPPTCTGTASAGPTPRCCAPWAPAPRSAPTTWCSTGRSPRGAGVYFTTPAEVAALCEAAEADPDAASARGSAGQADVAVRYRWSDVADAYEDLARELLSTRRGR